MKCFFTALTSLFLLLFSVLPVSASAQAEAPLGIDAPFEITQEQTVIETDRYILTLEPGIYVPSTIEDDINMVMDVAEEITGLSYTPKTPIHPKIGKLKIEVLNPELHDGQFTAYAMTGGATLAAPDVLIWGGGGWAMLHELLHCLQNINGSVLSPTLAEGFATTGVLEATSKAPFPISLDSYHNYAIGKSLINENTAQSMFIELDQTDDGWNNYLYGFPMVLFMNEEYGRDAYLKLITLAEDEYFVADGEVYAANHTNAELLPLVLEATSEDFFTRFGAWYQANRRRVNPSSGIKPTNDYARFDRLSVFPQCYAYTYYDRISTRYQDELILDYTTGNRYLSEYKHITPKGFCGTISAKGESAFAFYTSAGEELATYALNGSSETVAVDNAALIRITRDGELVTVEADFDQMTRPE